MADIDKHIYGPVPSRRLGLSLGVDIMPHKVCTLDCVYCQIGRTTELTLERKVYLPIRPVLAELEQRLREGVRADFVTIGGSGEPTLNSQLGELIDGIKALTDIPVAVLTNGTLLHRPDVRAECARADVVMPSLDAGDENTFGRLNRPHAGISIEMLVGGLCQFRGEFGGRLWLEVFVVAPLNTDSAQIARIGELIDRIKPDKTHLNTAVRPTAEPEVKRLTQGRMEEIARQLGRGCEIISDFAKADGRDGVEESVGVDEVLSMLRRRPCCVDDIASGLGIQANRVEEYVTELEKRGEIRTEMRDGRCVFKAR